MKPIDHVGKSSLKTLKGVLALWINDQDIVDAHCKVNVY